MTPAEASEIDRLEFEAECAAIRQRAYELVRKPALAEPEAQHPKAKLHTHDGHTATVKQWAAKLGLAPATIKRRMSKGLTFEQAITVQRHTCKPIGRKPTGRPAQRYTVDGVTLPLSEWAERLGLSVAALHVRLHKGWTIAEAVTVPKGHQRNRGVALNLPLVSGTGAGSTAQETPEITFSEEANS